MIKFEVFSQDGELQVSNEWPEGEARQLSACRMRWLRPGGNRAGLWARTTDADGRVRTYGNVPEGQEAKPGQYGVFEYRADGDYSQAEPVKHCGTRRSKASDWQLNHRLGGNPELVIRWAENKPEAAGPQAEIAPASKPDPARRTGPEPLADVLIALDLCLPGRSYQETARAILAALPRPHVIATRPDPYTEDHPLREYMSDGTSHPVAEPARHACERCYVVTAEVLRTPAGWRCADEHACNPPLASRDIEATVADPEPESAEITITSDDEPGSGTQAVRRGEVVACLRWSGSMLKVYFPGGTILGRLYRSDGERVRGEITYTYRAWTASDRLECKPGDTEAARGVSLPDAIAALLKHAADAKRQA